MHEDVFPAIPAGVMEELWTTAEAERYGLTLSEFAAVLESVGSKLNHNLPAGVEATSVQRIAFYRGLHLPELALAHACSLGHESAWAHFFERFRSVMAQAAIAITGSATLGHDLADSLYGDLYGLRQGADGLRRSPLASYTGRGSLTGWLRTSLAQRHVDHHRRTHRETELGDHDTAAAPVSPQPTPLEMQRLSGSLQQVLSDLPAEDCFLLSSYFLDRRTLHEIGRTLAVHEATISRRLKRLTGDLRHRLLETLQSGGLSRRAAEEQLGTDPRDLEINLRALLQTSQPTPFQYREAREDRAVPAAKTEPPLR